MQGNLAFVFGFTLWVLGTVVAGTEAPSPQCDVQEALSILQSLPSGSAYCSSYILQKAAPTKTKTQTVTVTGPCSTPTKTKTEHATFTETVYKGTTTLPTLTVTIYSSTVLVPRYDSSSSLLHATFEKLQGSPLTPNAIPGPNSGTVPSINKRTSDPTAAPANRSATSTTITNCASASISGACSSLIAVRPTITTTVTTTRTKPCDKPSTTTTTTTVTDRTVTSRILQSISPAPVFVTSTGVLTTTVPAACASMPYYPNGNGIGNDIVPLGYPYFPQTSVECCAICFTQQNCIASAAIFNEIGLAECDLLIHKNGSQPGVNALCPLGIQDYPFGSPEADGNVYPGPCGV